MHPNDLCVDPQRDYASQLWTPDQQKALEALCNALLPRLSAEERKRYCASLPRDLSDEQRAALESLADLQFSDVPHAVNLIAMHVYESMSDSVRLSIGALLYTLSTRAGCLALMGRLGPVWTLDRHTVVDVIIGWQSSPITLLRRGASGLKGLACTVFYRSCRQATNAMGYPSGVGTDWKEPPDAESAPEQPHYPFTFVNSRLPSGDVAELSTDVVVVGSGAGGAVTAAYLAERGLRVLVVDKGTYVPTDQLEGGEDFGMGQMYERLGVVPTDDASVYVIAGSGFGGGTTINWSATLPPRHFVRHSWAQKHGVSYFDSPQFTSDLEACMQRMGATAQGVQHNSANSLLALGAIRAGQPVSAVPQNSGGHVHYCGKCSLGCPAAHKQSTIVTWLEDAAKHRAEFLLHYDVERVLFSGKRATGVVGTVRGQKVVVRAKRGVVMAGGSINTPAVLLRTPELRANRQIGQHLTLHPVAFVQGFYDFEVDPFNGGILTMVSNAAELVDPEGWGAKIEVMASQPALFAALLPYHGVVEHRALVAQYRYQFTIIVIVRDRDGGRVSLDSRGRAVMHYKVSPHDQKSMLEGVLRATEIHRSAGARAIMTSQTDVPIFESKREADAASAPTAAPPTMPGTRPIADAPHGSLNDPAFVAWQSAIARVGFSPLRVMLGSAHQMSSCRMGRDPKTSALDPSGRVRGASGLWVSDASALPESTGVNPMLTTLTLARGVARNIAHELGVDTVPTPHL